MLKVALTGNIASGKSTVADMWRTLGARIVDADELARRAVEPGSAALERIRARWGDQVLDDSGALDRPAMRALVFRDPSARSDLEGIIHPAVAALRDRELAAARRAGVPVVVADIPLLFEVGLEVEFDLVVLVDAPEALRRDRIIQNRGLAEDEAARMIAAQIPSSEKRPRADIVIDNAGSLGELREKARLAWEEISRRAGVHA